MLEARGEHHRLDRPRGNHDRDHPLSDRRRHRPLSERGGPPANHACSANGPISTTATWPTKSSIWRPTAARRRACSCWCSTRERVVGASTGVPMADETDDFKRPFLAQGYRSGADLLFRRVGAAAGVSRSRSGRALLQRARGLRPRPGPLHPRRLLRRRASAGPPAPSAGPHPIGCLLGAPRLSQAPATRPRPTPGRIWTSSSQAPSP